MAPLELSTKITEGGRVVIPAEYRRILNIEIGDDIFVKLEEGEIRILSKKEALRRAKELVKHYAGSRSLSQELIQERKEEVKNESRLNIS